MAASNIGGSRFVSVGSWTSNYHHTDSVSYSVKYPDSFRFLNR